MRWTPLLDFTAFCVEAVNKVRRPRDEAGAEKCIQVVEASVLAVLRNCVFFTLDEADTAIQELIAAVNARPLTTNKALTRRMLFGE